MSHNINSVGTTEEIIKIFSNVKTKRKMEKYESILSSKKLGIF